MEMRNEVRNNFNDVKDTVKKNVKEGMEKTGLSEENYRMIQSRAKEAMTASEDYIKSHPVYTVLGAAAVGFIVGSIFRR